MSWECSLAARGCIKPLVYDEEGGECDLREGSVKRRLNRKDLGTMSLLFLTCWNDPALFTISRRTKK
jgi:hypothetical protein